MIRIPAGVHTLDRQVIITRPRLVLRGDGSAATVLKIDKPLKAIPGVPRPGGGYRVKTSIPEAETILFGLRTAWGIA